MDRHLWALWSLYSNSPGCIQLCCGGVVTPEPWQSTLGLQNSIICWGGGGVNPWSYAESALGLQNSVICWGGGGGGLTHEVMPRVLLGSRTALFVWGGGGGVNPLMKLCLMGSGVPAFILLDRVSYVLYIKWSLALSLFLSPTWQNPRSLSLSCLSTVIASCSQLVKSNTQQYKWFISASACVTDSTWPWCTQMCCVKIHNQCWFLFFYFCFKICCVQALQQMMCNIYVMYTLWTSLNLFWFLNPLCYYSMVWFRMERNTCRFYSSKLVPF